MPETNPLCISLPVAAESRGIHREWEIAHNIPNRNGILKVECHEFPAGAFLHILGELLFGVISSHCYHKRLCNVLRLVNMVQNLQKNVYRLGDFWKIIFLYFSPGQRVIMTLEMTISLNGMKQKQIIFKLWVSERSEWKVIFIVHLRCSISMKSKSCCSALSYNSHNAWRSRLLSITRNFCFCLRTELSRACCSWSMPLLSLSKSHTDISKYTALTATRCKIITT